MFARDNHAEMSKFQLIFGQGDFHVKLQPLGLIREGQLMLSGSHKNGVSLVEVEFGFGIVVFLVGVRVGIPIGFHNKERVSNILVILDIELVSGNNISDGNPNRHGIS